MHTKRERHTHSQGDTHTLRDIHKEMIQKPRKGIEGIIKIVKI